LGSFPPVIWAPWLLLGLGVRLKSCVCKQSLSSELRGWVIDFLSRDPRYQNL
jgi:hypothetical protein